MASTVVYKTDSNKIDKRPLPESFRKDWVVGARIKSPDGKEFCKILRIEEDDEINMVSTTKQPITQGKTMLRLLKSEVERKAYLVSKLKDLEESIKPLLEEYNGIIGSINEFAENIKQRQQDYYDDRSESWQESDRGMEYECWKDEWDSFYELDEIECPDFVDIEEFENLPDSMG
jgi:hypothetical protein